MRQLLLVGLLIAVMTAATADAAIVPVPLATQRAITRQASTLNYIPARLPLGFSFAHWGFTAKPKPVVRIWFQARRRPPTWQIIFVVTKRAGACPTGEKTYQVDGSKVYWSHSGNEQQAWRCVAGANGTRVQLTALTPIPPTAFAAVGLAQVAAAGRRIR